jgi:predicted esterase
MSTPIIDGILKEPILPYTTYRQVDQKVDQLFDQQKYGEAIELLGKAREQFPDDLFEILWYEIIIYAYAEKYGDCLETLEEGVAHGFFFNLWSIFDPLRDDGRFKAVAAANQQLKAAAQAQAKMRYEVYTPAEYSTDRLYPLFIALHGDGQSLDYFKSNWQATPILEQGFVLVYVQSSQVICTNGFGWTPDYAITRQDVKVCYDEVAQRYNIDPANVLIGGFSGGSIASIEVTMSNTVPVRGFIALCPSLKPESFTPKNVAAAQSRGVKGVIMEGEQSGDVPAEQEMIKVFQETDFPHQFHIIPNVGHAIPKDFSSKLLNAMEFIMS